MNLISAIKIQQGVIRKLEDDIKNARFVLEEMKKEQGDCDHEFTPPIKNYEHEGGTCVKCGINEVYACCSKIGAKYK